MDGEKNDVFYIFTVQTGGTLRFTLTPNNGQNDYDWSVFNMTNADCSQLYPEATTLQVSCNSYGVIGYNGATGINSLLGNLSNCNGPGTTNGPPFNKDLTVEAGETYLINISNWSSSSQSGYTLDFTASTATIYDNIPPEVDSVQEEVPCSGATQLYLRFSENVRCEDVYQHPEKFTLTGSAGAIVINDVISSDCSTGATQSPVYTLVLASSVNAGSFSLNIVGDIRDLCDNIAQYNGFPFEVSEINAPVAGAGNDTTVANGAIIVLHGSASGGIPGYSWHWEPASLLVDPDVQEPVTLNMGASTLFILDVTDSQGCHSTDDVLVTVIGGPLGVSVTATPGEICHGESSQLNAIGSGGSGNYTFAWTSNPPGFTSNLQNPLVFPALTTIYLVEIADGFSASGSSTTVTVHPLPVANAGPDCSIPHGTTTTLHATASGGSGNYGYSWTSNPPGFTSTIQNPVTPNMTQTTVFSLIVTDQSTGCQSEPDDVIVNVTGSPLSVNPIATPSSLCRGNSTQLLPMTSGGSGTYTYNWSSVPAGFSSQQPDPVVSPQMTTLYALTVNDGFNQAAGSVNVIVYPLPVIPLGPPDTTVCIYDSLLLDAGNDGIAYYWSNGAVTPSIRIGTTGLGFDIQTYQVKVVNVNGCIDSASIQVTFSFDACVGTETRNGSPDIRVFPNPTTGELTLEIPEPHDEIRVSLYTVLGREIMNEVIPGQNGKMLVRKFDLSEYSKGIYILKVTDSRTSTARQVVMHE
jgi:hypothetical protein